MTVQELLDALKDETERAKNDYEELQEFAIEKGDKIGARYYNGIMKGWVSALNYIEWYIDKYGE